MIFLVTRIACYLYFMSMVSTYPGVTEPKIVAGIGFLLGTFGGSLMAAIIRAIKAADLWVLIRQRFGRRQSAMDLELINSIVCGLIAFWATRCGLSGRCGTAFLGS